MFVITNRNIVKNAIGFAQVGVKCNAEGPAELRLLEANRAGKDWSVNVLPNTIDAAMKKEAGIVKEGDVFASEYVFHKLLAIVNPRFKNPKSTKPARDVVLFVHGFNNTLQDVVERCEKLSKAFDLEVIAFSWPAHGGGAKGALDYLADKRNAQASVVAFDRVLALTYDLVTNLRREVLKTLARDARQENAEHSESERLQFVSEAERDCPVQISLLLHSMGNYLLERTLKSSALRGGKPMFDNVVLCAADVNNPGHAEWVDQIQPRNRLYVTINEDDFALQASRVKGGDEQLARLGHWTRSLDSRQAMYVDFTHATHVGKSHAYFEEDALSNQKIQTFFHQALHGERAEDTVKLKYDAARNLHELA